MLRRSIRGPTALDEVAYRVGYPKRPFGGSEIMRIRLA